MGHPKIIVTTIDFIHWHLASQDNEAEIFKEPKRWSDWVLNETSGLHECPIDYPTSNIQGDNAYSPPDWRVSIGTWICKKTDEDKMRRWNTSSKSWNSDEDLIDE